MAEDAEGARRAGAGLRIVVDELPPREPQRQKPAPDPVLERLGAAEGAPCHLDCDCRIGLVCADGICSEKE